MKKAPSSPGLKTQKTQSLKPQLVKNVSFGHLVPPSIKPQVVRAHTLGRLKRERTQNLGIVCSLRHGA
eukprot:3711168-Prymnesium_polylepis.1